MQIHLKKLHHVRKSMVFFILLTLVLSFQKFYSEMSDQEKGSSKKVEMKGRQNIEVILCKKILNSRPLGIVNQNSRAGKRIYLFQDEFEGTQIIHKWYFEGENILSFECPEDTALCISSISPHQAEVGDWSVDVVDNGQLLFSKQFSLVR